MKINSISLPKFVKIETLGGFVLLCGSLLAILWANSPYGHIYESLLDYKIGIETQKFHLTKPLKLWIDDGLMTIFFFLIGLEIKREILIGELNSIKKASFPIFAAIGGMVIPISLFLSLNDGAETIHGWGIPMATDIAFSLAILNLLGNRVSISLKIFLTAFAIVDDLGAILVIALFYSSGIKFMLLIYAIILLVVLFLLSYKNIYSKYLVLVFGIVIWLLLLKSGIHPTISGVFLAFAIPIRRKIDIRTYTDNLLNIVDKIKKSKKSKQSILSKKQIQYIDDLYVLNDHAQSPLQYLEHRLHKWVAYFIMPIFALANSGVRFSNDMVLDYNLIINLCICLLFGNLIGITSFSILSARLGLSQIPKGITYRQILGVSFIAGVGFTMSIFISNLAFTDKFLLDSSKLGIILGSIISGTIGYMVLRFFNPSKKG